jgi:hypothetical protein
MFPRSVKVMWPRGVLVQATVAGVSATALPRSSLHHKMMASGLFAMAHLSAICSLQR